MYSVDIAHNASIFNEPQFLRLNSSHSNSKIKLYKFELSTQIYVSFAHVRVCAVEFTQNFSQAEQGSHEDAEGDEELVPCSERASVAHRSDFCQVHRRQLRREPCNRRCQRHSVCIAAVFIQTTDLQSPGAIK